MSVLEFERPPKTRRSRVVDAELVTDGRAGDDPVELAARRVLAGRSLWEGLAELEGLSLVELLELIEGVYFDESKHPRWPAGTPGGLGGQFMHTGQRFRLHGVEYDVAQVLPGRIVANVATHGVASKPGTVEFTTEQLAQAERPPAEVIKGSSNAHEAVKKITATVVDAYVHPETHDPAIPIPADSAITAEEWQRFGRVDQLRYAQVQERYGKYKASESQSKINAAYKSLDDDSQQLLNQSYSQQYGYSNVGFSLSLHGVFKALFGEKPGSAAAEKARAKYEKTRAAQFEVAGVIQWDLYNRTHSPDLTIMKGHSDNAFFTHAVFKDGVPIYAGASFSQRFAQGFFGANKFIAPMAIRNVVMSTVSGYATPHHAFQGEQEIAMADPWLADPDRALNVPDHPSGGGGTHPPLTSMQQKWLGKITAQGAGGQVVDELLASFADGGVNLPVPPAAAEIVMDGQAGKQWQTPPAEATKFAMLGGQKTSVLELPYDEVMDGHPVAKKMKDMVDAGEIHAGDYIEGLKGTRYIVIADPSDSYLGLAYYKITDTGQKMPGTEFENKATGQEPSGAFEGHTLWQGGEEVYGFEGGGEKAWKKLKGHYDLTVAQQAKQEEAGFYAAAWAVGGPDDAKFLKDFDPGQKFIVAGTAYQVVESLPGGQKKIKDLETKKLGKINGDYKSPPLVLKAGYTETGEAQLDPSDFLHGDTVELGTQLDKLPTFFLVGQTVWKTQQQTSDGHVEAAQASGEKIGQLHTFGADQKATLLTEKPPGWEPAQAGDTFALDGAKATITKLLKDGTVQAKKQAGGVVKLHPNDAALAFLHRPAAWELGDKTKLKNLAPGQKFHGGTGVQQIRPYVVVEQKGKLTMVRNLDTGEVMPMSSAKSFAQLNLKQTAAAAVPEDHTVPPAPTAYDPDLWQAGPEKMAADLKPGDKFLATTSQGAIPYEIGEATADGGGWHVKNLTDGSTAKIGKTWPTPLPTLVAKTAEAAPEPKTGWLPASSVTGLQPGDQFKFASGSQVTLGTAWEVTGEPDAGNLPIKVVASVESSAIGKTSNIPADWTADLLVHKPETPTPALPAGMEPNTLTLLQLPIGAHVMAEPDPGWMSQMGVWEVTGFSGGKVDVKMVQAGIMADGSVGGDVGHVAHFDPDEVFPYANLHPAEFGVPSGGQVTPSKLKPGDYFKFAVSGAVFKITKVEPGQAHGLSVDTTSGTAQPGEIALNENPGVLVDQYGDVVFAEAPVAAPAAPSLAGASSFDPSAYNRVKNGVAGDLKTGQVFTVSDLDVGDVFEGAKGGHYQLKSFGKDNATVNATVLDGPNAGKHTKFKATVKPAALLDPKAVSVTPYAELLPGDPVKLGDLQAGDQFTSPMSGDALWEIVEPSGGTDEKNATVAFVNPGGELGVPTDQGAPPSLVVKLHAKKADTVMVPPQQVEAMQPDPESLDPPTIAYASYKFHKSGTKKYPKLSSMADGVIFHDSEGVHYKVKQAGAEPVITDGTSLFKADGNWRGFVVDPTDAPALTGPYGDGSPSMVATHQEVEQQLAVEGLTPNDGSWDLAALKLEIGDSFQAESGTIYKITGKPASGGFSVYDGASGDSATLPNYLVPTAYAKAFTMEGLIQDDEPDLPSPGLPEIPTAGIPQIPGAALDNVLPLSSLAPGTHFSLQGGVYEVGPKSQSGAKVAVKIITPSPGQQAQSSLTAGDTMTLAGDSVPDQIGPAGAFDTVAAAPAGGASPEAGDYVVVGKGLLKDAPPGTEFVAGASSWHQSGEPNPTAAVYQVNGPATDEGVPMKNLKAGTSFSVGEMTAVVYLKPKNAGVPGYQPYVPNTKMLSDLPAGARFHHPLMGGAEMEVLPWEQQSDENPETYAKYVGSGDEIGLQDFVPDMVSLPIGTPDDAAPAAFGGPAEPGSGAWESPQAEVGDTVTWSTGSGVVTEVGDHDVVVKMPGIDVPQNIPKTWVTTAAPTAQPKVPAHGDPVTYDGKPYWVKGMVTDSNNNTTLLLGTSPGAAGASDGPQNVLIGSPKVTFGHAPQKKATGQPVKPSDLEVGDLVLSMFNQKTLLVTKKGTPDVGGTFQMTLKDQESGVEGAGTYSVDTPNDNFNYVGKSVSTPDLEAGPVTPSGVYAEPLADKQKPVTSFNVGDVVMQPGWNGGVYRVMALPEGGSYGKTQLKVVKPASESYEQQGMTKNVWGSPQYLPYPGGPMWKAGEYAKLVKAGNVTGKTVRVVGHDGPLIRVRYVSGKELTVEPAWLQSSKPTYTTKQKLLFQKVPVSELKPGDIFNSVDGYYDSGQKYVFDKVNDDGSVTAHYWGSPPSYGSSEKTFAGDKQVEPLVAARSVAALPQPQPPPKPTLTVPAGAPNVGDKVTYAGEPVYVAYKDEQGLTFSTSPGEQAVMVASWAQWKKSGQLAPDAVDFTAALGGGPVLMPNTIPVGQLPVGSLVKQPPDPNDIGDLLDTAVWKIIGSPAYGTVKGSIVSKAVYASGQDKGSPVGTELDFDVNKVFPLAALPEPAGQAFPAGLKPNKVALDQLPAGTLVSAKAGQGYSSFGDVTAAVWKVVGPSANYPAQSVTLEIVKPAGDIHGDLPPGASGVGHQQDFSGAHVFEFAGAPEPVAPEGTVKAGTLQLGSVFSVPTNVISPGGPEAEWIVTSLPAGEEQPWVYAKPLAGGSPLPYGVDVDVKLVSTPGWTANTSGLSIGDLQVGDRFKHEGGEFEITQTESGESGPYAKVLKAKNVEHAVKAGEVSPFSASTVPDEIAGPQWPKPVDPVAEKIKAGLAQVLAAGPGAKYGQDLVPGDVIKYGNGKLYTVHALGAYSGETLAFGEELGDQITVNDNELYTLAPDGEQAPPLTGEKVPGDQVPGVGAVQAGDFVETPQGNVYEIKEKLGSASYPTITVALAKNSTGDLPSVGKEWTSEYNDQNVQTWKWAAKPETLPPGEKKIRDLEVGDQFVATEHKDGPMLYEVTAKNDHAVSFVLIKPSYGKGGIHEFDMPGVSGKKLGDSLVTVKDHVETMASAAGADVLSPYNPKWHKSGQHATPKIGTLAPGTQFHDKTGKLYVVIGKGATGYTHYSNVPGPGGVVKEYATPDASRVVVVQG